MKDLKTYANAIFQNANVGMQSIHDILPKIENSDLKKELKSEYADFESICNKIRDFSEKNNFELSENNIFEKAKMWTSINLSTAFNDSTRHITELMLLGTVMGTTTCYKDKFDHKNINETLDGILDELEEIEEKNFKNLKTFLKYLN